MQGFTTTADGDWEFNLDDPEPPKINSDTYEMAPILGTAEQWENYTNEILFEWEQLVRQWILRHAENKEWTSATKNRRYTMKMVIEEITGEEYDQAKFAKVTPVLRKILAFYSTKVAKAGSINGKQYSKTIYTISQKRAKSQKPISLKLRLKMYKEQGIIPTAANMKVHSDKTFLKPGQARNPKTQETIDKRRAAAKERYNERYRDRKH